MTTEVSVVNAYLNKEIDFFSSNEGNTRMSIWKAAQCAEASAAGLLGRADVVSNEADGMQTFLNQHKMLKNFVTAAGTALAAIEARDAELPSETVEKVNGPVKGIEDIEKVTGTLKEKVWNVANSYMNKGWILNGLDNYAQGFKTALEQNQ